MVTGTGNNAAGLNLSKKYFICQIWYIGLTLRKKLYKNDLVQGFVKLGKNIFKLGTK